MGVVWKPVVCWFPVWNEPSCAWVGPADAITQDVSQVFGAPAEPDMPEPPPRTPAAMPAPRTRRCSQQLLRCASVIRDMPRDDASTLEAVRQVLDGMPATTSSQQVRALFDGLLVAEDMPRCRSLLEKTLLPSPVQGRLDLESPRLTSIRLQFWVRTPSQARAVLRRVPPRLVMAMASSGHCNFAVGHLFRLCSDLPMARLLSVLGSECILRMCLDDRACRCMQRIVERGRLQVPLSFDRVASALGVRDFFAGERPSLSGAAVEILRVNMNVRFVVRAMCWSIVDRQTRQLASERVQRALLPHLSCKHTSFFVAD